MISIELKLDTTNWLEAIWMDEGVQIRCVSYHPVQIDMLRSDALEMGTSLEEHQGLLNEWVASYTPPQIDIDTLKRELRSVVTNARWRLETGGITLPNGSKIKTSIDDQNRITSVISNAERAGLTEINFKDGDDNWTTMSLSYLIEISKIITFWVQDCFNAEMRHHEAINSLTTQEQIEDYRQNRINTDWPERERELPQVPN